MGKVIALSAPRRGKVQMPDKSCKLGCAPPEVNFKQFLLETAEFWETQGQPKKAGHYYYVANNFEIFFKTWKLVGEGKLSVTKF